MKKTRRILVMHFTCCLMLSLLGCSVTPTPTPTPNPTPAETGQPQDGSVNTDYINEQNAIAYHSEKTVQWSTSFESTEGFVGRVTRSENTGEYTDASLPDGDSVFLIDRAQVQATPVMTEYGSVEALFDQSTLTKYITHKRPSAKDPVSIMLPLKSPLAMNWYTITSANDVKERDPKDWTVYGSRDGETWEVVHEVKNYNFPVREDTHLFRFENEETYRFYKWEITRTGGQEHTQLAGLRIGRGSGEISVYTTNIGAIFRSAAALAIDAVLLTRNSCDPLNRRAIRVSMGSVFLLPWTWLDTPASHLHSLGFRTAAMALTDNSVSLDDPRLKQEPRLAIIMGTEGDGLPQTTIEDSDYVVRIPMSHHVDSLNVAAAAAVAFWELRAL